MITFIAYAFIILVVAHLVYEGIIAPTFRLRVKFAFFALRDRAFRVHAETPDALPREEYDLLVDSIEGIMKYIDDMTLSYLFMYNKYAPDEVKEEAIKRARMFEGAKSDEVREIAHEFIYYAEALVITNNLGLFLTILPFALVVLRVRTVIRALAFRGNKGEGELAMT